MSVVSDEQIRRWERELTLVKLTEACPYCDGPIEYQTLRNPDDVPVGNWECGDCDQQWIAILDD